jgi:hypothetical protein
MERITCCVGVCRDEDSHCNLLGYYNVFLLHNIKQYHKPDHINIRVQEQTILTIHIMVCYSRDSTTVLRLIRDMEENFQVPLAWARDILMCSDSQITFQ